MLGAVLCCSVKLSTCAHDALLWPFSAPSLFPHAAVREAERMSASDQILMEPSAPAVASCWRGSTAVRHTPLPLCPFNTAVQVVPVHTLLATKCI